MELSGEWRAHPADEDLRRAFHEHGFDDGGWLTVPVPGHWRDVPDLAPADGPVLHRREFSHPDPADPQRRLWLWLDGVFSQGDVWLDGTYLGDTEGYFVPHAFEVTELMAARSEHVLAVEVSCPPVDDTEPKRALTGAYQSATHLPAGANPGGIWRPVHVRETGPIAIRHGRVVCREATEERAILALRLVLDTSIARPARIHTTVAGVHHELEHPLAAGENRVEWTVTVANPDRWWPHALGAQVLHDVRVEVRLDDDTGVRLDDDTGDGDGRGDELAVDRGPLSDSRTWRTGFRAIEMRGWVCRVNGERLFLKGANLSPLSASPAAATPSSLTRLLRTARDAGLDMVRLHTHIAPPSLYTAADELGMLLWQDLPLHGRYARSVRRQAVRQAREVVDLLGHHPSVAIWCAHDEPFTTGSTRRKAIEPGVLPQQLPTWNRSILDRSIKRVLQKSDGTRPVVAHSGVLPHFPNLDGTDAHLWFGWYGGKVADLAGFASTLPRQVRFVSAFGAQSLTDDEVVTERSDPASTASTDDEVVPASTDDEVVPASTDDEVVPERSDPASTAGTAGTEPDWEQLAARGVEVDTLRRVVPFGPPQDLRSWAQATRDHQADVVRSTIETLRRLKYRPTGGFSVHRLVDPEGHPGFGLLGADGSAKPAWDALRAACRSLVVIADPFPEALASGDAVDLAVHVVSDEHIARPGCLVTASLRSAGGNRTWRWLGDIGADECVLVGRIKWTADDIPGPVELELQLEHDGTTVTNRYSGRIR